MKCERGYYDVFVRTCAKYPANIAVRLYDGGVYRCYTYSELYGVCEYIAQNLQQLQCTKGVIGLVSKRNIIIPCVIAASHKCCTTFMFIDPSQEVEALASDMKFQVVISITRNDNTAPTEYIFRKPDKTITIFNHNISFYYYEHQLASRHAHEHSFIALTSGSTGEPKQIQVPIQCIQPNIDDLTKLFDVTPDDIIFFSTPLTFDPSMVEILLACMNGASLLIAPDKADVLFPENGEHSVTIWQTTPSKFFQYSNADIRDKFLCANSTLKILALGGEPLNGIKRIKELKHCGNKTRIFTLYGVTEMSCWACAAELDLNKCLTDREIPLGQCLSETQVVVEPDSDSNKNTGKIILVSKTRKCIILNNAKGNEEMNSLKFVDTGDVAEVKNGTIYYRGRKDDIIKRFGHKINLQSIEYTIMQCPQVKTCSCVWLPKPMLLVVYFSSETLSSKELSDFLKCKLDDKHWPDKVVRVNNMPTNIHGKISKLVLSKLYEKMPSAPMTLDSLRVMFLQELKTTLNLNFNYNDIKDKSFFTIGGTSFLAVTLCNRMSLINPQFGKLILPYLLSLKHTIDEVMIMAEKELCVDELSITKRPKRTLSDSDDSADNHSNKRSTSPIQPVEFVTLWSFDTGKCVDASPTLFQNGCNLYVAVGSHSGKIVVFDALSGHMQGMIRLKARVEASVYCYLEEPLNIPCGVVGAYDGTVVCFTLEGCQQKWSINIGSMVKSKATSCNGFLYIASYDGSIRCIDIMTGAIKNSIYVTDQAISADLVLAKNEYILTGTLSGVCASIHTETSAVAWRGSVSSPVFASPALYDEDKYVVFAEVNGEIHCRTVEKGIKIWKYQGAKGNIFSSIHIREIEKLKWQMVFGCHDNKVYSITIKNFQPTLHWKTQLDAPVYSTPCGLNDKLLLAVSKSGTMYIIIAENGVILAEYHFPHEVFSSPASFNDYIFVGCRNDYVYALKYILNV